MILKSLGSAEKFVKAQQSLGNTLRWEGWDIVIFWPQKYAAQSVEGVYDRATQQWGFTRRVPVSADGTWEVPDRNVRHSRRPRNRG
jgi:hypothetical protein